jgi:aryl-alcohol dehydrogenase-like predicted oxidoreductase
MPDHENARGSVSRRQFLIAGGAAAAVGTWPGATAAEEAAATPRVQRYRTLGRTGFEVSDISIGGAGRDANLYRYAYDHGINYFDTAESYGNGDNERRIGEALAHMDRSKVWITTKLHFEDAATEAELLDRFDACQQRLSTDYVDALYMHSVKSAAFLDHKGFHAAVKRLKADGRVRHAGVSCHGPRDGDGESMAKVLTAAAEDGRFDLMLLSYNFMNRDEAEDVLDTCAERKVGTTAMKTAPGSVEMEPFDPENPSERYQRYINGQVEAGTSREQAVADIQEWIAEQEKAYAEAKPFMEKHGVSGKAALRLAAVQWVLSNPDMHTVCVGFRDFESIDSTLPLSGTKVSRGTAAALDRYRMAASASYCRHGCTGCSGACPHGVPVSTVMRYAYYFTEQGREKLAMSKYARLGGRRAIPCPSCTAPCSGACPHGVNIQANLVSAHDLLTLA